MAELDIYERLGEFEEGLKIVEKIEENLEAFKDKSSKEHLIVFYLKFSLIYIGLKDYNKGLFWINKILNDNEKLLRQDLYSYTRLINLIVHFELGNFDLIEYLIKSTQRFLNKKNRDFELETLIISNIKKLSKCSDVVKQREIFIQFREKLEELFKNPDNEILFNYFDFLSWVDSEN